LFALSLFLSFSLSPHLPRLASPPCPSPSPPAPPRIPAGHPAEARFRAEVARHKLALNKEKAALMGAEVILGDPEFMGEVLAFYR
jgi:hypothetical protein